MRGGLAIWRVRTQKARSSLEMASVVSKLGDTVADTTECVFLRFFQER